MCGCGWGRVCHGVRRGVWVCDGCGCVMGVGVVCVGVCGCEEPGED